MTDQTIPKKKRRTKEQVAADLAARIALQPADPPKVKKPQVQKPKVIVPVLPISFEYEQCPIPTPPPQVRKSPQIFGRINITEVKAPKTFWQKLKDFLFS